MAHNLSAGQHDTETTMRTKPEHRDTGGFTIDILDLARGWGGEISEAAQAVRHRVRGQHHRRLERRELLKMDSRQLQDIGLTPDDVPAVLDGTFFHDASRNPHRSLAPRGCAEKRA